MESLASPVVLARPDQPVQKDREETRDRSDRQAEQELQVGKYINMQYSQHNERKLNSNFKPIYI